MIIKEWEIWHTYASYFMDPIGDLDTAAKNLIQSGLLSCAFMDNGDYYWLNDSKLVNGHAEITLEANRSAAWIRFTSPTPKGYAGKTLHDCVYFRFLELRQFSHFKNFPPRYIRGYLGECKLFSKEFIYNVYPIIKLFSTGIILVELRILSPQKGIGLERFVNEYRNLSLKSFDKVLVPPLLRVAAQHAFALSEKSTPSLIQKLGSYLIDRDLQNNINKNLTTKQSGDFEFEYIPLWDIDAVEKEEKGRSKDNNTKLNIYKTSDLATNIIDAVSITVPKLRRGKSLLLKANKLLVVGDFWSGRPHTHLLKFEGQSSTAQMNETKFQNELGWIIGGIYQKNRELGKQFLPKNGRLFDDYGAYIAAQGSLWVWSKKGISGENSYNIPDNLRLVFPNQSLCEALEYGYMLYRRMYESVGTLRSPETALKERANLVELEDAINNLSNYGEIHNLLIQGWDAMGVTRLKTAISDLIAIRHNDASAKEGKRFIAFQTILSIIFGVAAIPSFATGVVKPLWAWLRFWQPVNQDAAEVWFFTIALIFILVPIYFITRSVLGKQS